MKRRYHRIRRRHGASFLAAALAVLAALAVVVTTSAASAVEDSPVAVAKAIPNPGMVGQAISLDGSGSFHQDPAFSIDSWDWDLDDDGFCDDASGPVVTTSFGALGDYPVTLCVSDDGDPEMLDDTTLVVQMTALPIAPTADANGPYAFCPQAQPWFLDGSGSVNPDEGASQSGAPGDTIQEYAWELDGDAGYDDAYGPQPDVTALFTALGQGVYLIQLRVTDTTSLSFPGSGLGDLSDADAAQVHVLAASDPACGCVDDLVATGGGGQITLSWTDTAAAVYNVYRSATQGGPYVLVGKTTDAYFVDSDVLEGVTYYYVLREALLSGEEVCQSNEASSDAAGAICDADDDGDVDLHDIGAIFDARGTPATGPDDPMDANGDGIVTVNDSRLCVLECDLEGCEEPAPLPGACGLLGIEPLLLLGPWLRRR